MSTIPLLGPKDIAPVIIGRPEGASAMVLVCEHAGNRLPLALADLGVDPEVLSSHAGWDIGALAVAERLSAAFDATLIAQPYSRLAHDCNRPPDSPAAVPEKSEIYLVPGNAGLTGPERAARAEAFYHPFHAAIDGVLERHRAAGRASVLVTIHSFTPFYFGVSRDGRLGILHDADSRLADRMLAAAVVRGLEGVRRNYPYGVEDGVTHTLQRHALARGLENVMIEIRNDLIADEAGQALWAERLGELLRGATSQAGQEGGLQHG